MITLGVTLGDVTGIGPEVALKAVRRPEFAGAALVLLGDPGTLRRWAASDGTTGPLPLWPGPAAAGPGLWSLPVGAALPDTLPAGDPRACAAALESLRDGAHRCLRGEWDGLVTAPVNKEAILRTGIPFTGQTEFLTGIAGHPETAMMLLGTDDRGRWLRVALATTHLPLKDVPGALTSESLERVIRLASDACIRLGLPRRRVAVCGLNPHAGEGGLMGGEELEIIRPAIHRARQQGFEVDGPWPADTLFHQALHGSCDAVVAMYHDQGLAPLKLVAFDTGVNWTLGLPFVRTSPDHGTAYDLAGRGMARPDSMASAIRLALQLAQESRCRQAASRQSAADGT